MDPVLRRCRVSPDVRPLLSRIPVPSSPASRNRERERLLYRCHHVRTRLVREVLPEDEPDTVGRGSTLTPAGGIRQNRTPPGQLYHTSPTQVTNAQLVEVTEHNTNLPASLAALTGPASGVVELPPELAWSGRRVFDLAVAEQWYLYHMTVLTAR